MSVTALVPCYNEEKRIHLVLEALSSFAIIDQILVVDDGSSDNTSTEVAAYPKIKLVKLEKNIGKGGAVREGLRHVTTDITYLCDGDLNGLKQEELEKVLRPVIENDVQICVGVLKRHGKFYQFLRRNLLPLISGQRAVKTDLLKKIMSHKQADGWGIEPFMNAYCKRNKIKIKRVDLNGIRDVLNMRKRGFKYFSDRLMRYFKIYSKTIPYKFGL